MENNSKENNLDIPEAFYSVQGEGKFVGVSVYFCVLSVVTSVV